MTGDTAHAPYDDPRRANSSLSRGPGIAVAGALENLLRELTGDDVGDRHVLEDVADARPQGHPHVAKRRGTAGELERIRPCARDVGQRPVDRSDDIGDGD